ncbi:MAG: ABC transporter substrate-binding protein [Robiginitomaculum sp.]|nr:ABC transporter substrate-binding protein [Robiginitomaculum sp.]MDQ7078843.1 ABC transporter substrate-binding protein [Robiginitomaculum sp.]
MAASVHSFKLVSVLIGLLVFAGVGFAAPAKAAPEHVVSTSLCGDSYVLALVPPQRITALSWQADTKLSAAPAFLRHKDKGMASAERLARLHPDLVVLGPGDPRRAAKVVQKAGAKVLSLNWTEDFEGVFDNLRALGGISGQTQTASTKIKTIKARLAALKNRVPKGPVRVLYLTPSGNSAGAGVFVDAAILAAGGINHGATLGIKGWGRVPLEKLTLNPPDLIITSFFNEAYPSIANLRSRHPLMQRVMQNTPTVRIAAKNWICAGPRLINAAEEIAKAMDALAPQATAS